MDEGESDIERPQRPIGRDLLDSFLLMVCV